MKSYIIFVSLIAIFAVGGIGMFLTIPDQVDFQKSAVCVPPEIAEKLNEDSSYAMTLTGFDFITTAKCVAKNFVINNLDEKYEIVGEVTSEFQLILESLPPRVSVVVDLSLKDNSNLSSDNIEQYRIFVGVSQVDKVDLDKIKANIKNNDRGWQETQSPLKDNIESKQSTINSESGYQGNLMTEAQKSAFNERMNEIFRQNTLKEDSFNLTITEMTKSYDGENCNLSEEPKVCFVTSFENCTNAIYSEIHHTIEGDPILSIRKINSTNQTSCSIDFFVDNTADNYGVGSQSKLICYGVRIDEEFNNYLRMDECEKLEQ